MDRSYFIIKCFISLLILLPIHFVSFLRFVFLAVILSWESSREEAAAAAPWQSL